MNTKQINAANADELMEQREQSQACLGYAESRQKKTEGQKIMQLYETAFPEDEQIPWDDLMRLVGEMPLDFTAYYDGEAFVGFTIVIHVSHSTGSGTLPCERNCEAKVMASRSLLS